jgi:hypothetical protein
MRCQRLPAAERLRRMIGLADACPDVAGWTMRCRRHPAEKRPRRTIALAVICPGAAGPRMRRQRLAAEKRPQRTTGRAGACLRTAARGVPTGRNLVCQLAAIGLRGLHRPAAKSGGRRTRWTRMDAGRTTGVARIRKGWIWMAASAGRRAAGCAAATRWAAKCAPPRGCARRRWTRRTCGRRPPAWDRPSAECAMTRCRRDLNRCRSRNIREAVTAAARRRRCGKWDSRPCTPPSWKGRSRHPAWPPGGHPIRNPPRNPVNATRGRGVTTATAAALPVLEGCADWRFSERAVSWERYPRVVKAFTTAGNQSAHQPNRWSRL